MTWPLYMDQHVPSAVTKGLRRRKIDVLTAFDDSASEWEDPAILGRANELGRIVFTQDEDFLSLATEWRDAGRTFFGVVFCPQERLGHGALIDWLELVVSLLNEEEVRDQVIFLPMN